ncbi:MAG TPA: SLC13 family permease [Candidatus Acidoferrales bacterium]|nr:SLC13 family permease [Candidatus Acidoferrales bacterium]
MRVSALPETAGASRYHAAVTAALTRAADVCAFLIGIMALAELARHEELFDWLAGRALQAARGSRRRLFTLVYLVGVAVTVLLSNDTAAVVLTPAIAAALRRTDAPPLPYLFACAFVANAASYVLPISNPANLVVFGRALPPLHMWLSAFGISALAAVLCTYAGLRIAFRTDLRGSYTNALTLTRPAPAASLSAAAIALSALGLVIASALHLDLGIAAVAGAIFSLAVVTVRERGAAAFVARHIAWQVVPLVVGLFVLVALLERSGLLNAVHALLLHGNRFEVALIVTAASNAVNNLPVALVSGFALQSAAIAPVIAHATLVAVNLGPNVSVTGSLATMLWLAALRRDGYRVGFWTFLRIGSALTIPTLLVAVWLTR